MDEYYNYKYKKYKTKYLDLKGGYIKNEHITNRGILANNYYKPFGLYGLYGHITIKDKNGKTKNILNERVKYKKFVNDNTDPRLPNNEINYIHDLPIYENDDIVFEDNIIIKHLLEHCETGQYYSNIQSFEFVPYKKNIKTDEEEKKISEFIKDTYFAKDMLNENNEVDWLTINKYKRNRYRGLDLQQSEIYVKAYSEQAKKNLTELQYVTSDKILNEKRFDELLIQTKRSCRNLYKHYKNFSNGEQNVPVLLENELIENKKKQYLLSDFSLGVKYANNPKLSKDAYISSTSKLGKSGYNIMINKATIGCIANYNDMLFPIRIILDMNPNIMFYDNIYERIYLIFIDKLNEHFTKDDLNKLLSIINNKKIIINNNDNDKTELNIQINKLDTFLSIINKKEKINSTEKEKINNILNKYINELLNKEFNFTISNLEIVDILTLLYSDINDDINDDNNFINLINILIIKRYNNLEELYKFLNFTYYKNILQQSIINLFNYIFMIFFNNYYQYVGFWLIKFKNNYEEFEQIGNELKYLYDPTNSKPHNSREQYYIFFVFRDIQFEKMGIFFATYPNVNFRNNKIDVSSVVELKKILYHEILQLLCLYYKKQIYFYIILKQQNYEELNCNLQNQYLNNKMKYSKCSKVWLSKESEKIMKDNNFDIENNEIHVLVSNKNINDICICNKKKYRKQTINDINYIEVNNNYYLFECYFDYEKLDNAFKLDRFVIKLGNNKEIVNSTCFNDDKLLEFEDIRRTINFAYNIYKDETKEKYYY